VVQRLLGARQEGVDDIVVKERSFFVLKEPDSVLYCVHSVGEGPKEARAHAFG